MEPVQIEVSVEPNSSYFVISLAIENLQTASIHVQLVQPFPTSMDDGDVDTSKTKYSDAWDFTAGQLTFEQHLDSGESLSMKYAVRNITEQQLATAFEDSIVTVRDTDGETLRQITGIDSPPTAAIDTDHSGRIAAKTDTQSDGHDTETGPTGVEASDGTSNSSDRTIVDHDTDQFNTTVAADPPETATPNRSADTGSDTPPSGEGADDGDVDVETTGSTTRNEAIPDSTETSSHSKHSTEEDVAPTTERRVPDEVAADAADATPRSPLDPDDDSGTPDDQALDSESAESTPTADELPSLAVSAYDVGSTTRTIAVAGAKGGVGKTTTCINLGVALSTAGISTVVVELDLAMANLVDFIDTGIDSETDTTIHDVLAGDAPLSAATYELDTGLSIVPSGTNIADYSKTNPDRLATFLPELRERYDVVIFDTPAGLSKETIYPIQSADEVVLISTPRVSSVRNTENTMQIATRVDTDVSGLILTKSGTGASPGADRIADFLDVELLGHVPEDDAIPHSQDNGRAVVDHAPTSDAATAYRQIVENLLRTHDAPTVDSSTDTDETPADSSSDGDEDENADEDRTADSTPTDTAESAGGFEWATDPADADQAPEIEAEAETDDHTPQQVASSPDESQIASTDGGKRSSESSMSDTDSISDDAESTSQTGMLGRKLKSLVPW